MFHIKIQHYGCREVGSVFGKLRKLFILLTISINKCLIPSVVWLTAMRSNGEIAAFNFFRYNWYYEVFLMFNICFRVNDIHYYILSCYTSYFCFFYSYFSYNWYLVRMWVGSADFINKTCCIFQMLRRFQSTICSGVNWYGDFKWRNILATYDPIL